MKKLLWLFCLVSVTCFGQPGNKERVERLSHKPVFNDSAMLRLKQFDDSVIKEQQLKELDESIQRNNNYLLELQKEQRAKQKRGAIIRIAIGIGFLIILIIGLRRKGKKRDT